MSFFDKKQAAWSNGKWERRDFATIMDGLVLRYTLRGCDRSEISASRNHVSVEGTHSFTTLEDIAAFNDVLGRAWRQHQHLRANSRDSRDSPAEPDGPFSAEWRDMLTGAIMTSLLKSGISVSVGYNLNIGFLESLQIDLCAVDFERVRQILAELEASAETGDAA